MDLARLDYAWFTPAFRGNRTAPEPRLRVLLKPASYGAVLKRREQKDTGEVGERQRRILLAHVKGVEGLTLDGVPVTTAAQLWKAAVEEEAIHYELLLEILSAIDDSGLLEAGLGNGSGSPPASSS